MPAIYLTESYVIRLLRSVRSHCIDRAMVYLVVVLAALQTIIQGISFGDWQ